MKSVYVNPNWSLDVLGEQLRERGQLHNSPFSLQRFIPRASVNVSFASYVTTTRFSPLAPPVGLSEDGPVEGCDVCVSVRTKTTGTRVNPCAFV